MANKIERIASGINSVWGLFAIVAFFVIFGYTLSTNVRANGAKIDKSILVMTQQTEIMSAICESLADKDRDHAEFARVQHESTKTQREIVRLMDKIVVIMDRAK